MAPGTGFPEGVGRCVIEEIIEEPLFDSADSVAEHV
jgi:hypothetical protein